MESQLTCAAGWAFATAAAIESRLLINANRTVSVSGSRSALDLSEQQLLVRWGVGILGCRVLGWFRLPCWALLVVPLTTVSREHTLTCLACRPCPTHDDSRRTV